MNAGGGAPLACVARVGAPLLVAGGVVAVEAVQGALQFGRQFWFAAYCFCLAALLRQVVADARPQVPVGGQITSAGVVGDGHAGNLDDAALDGVDEREVRYHPGKQLAFGVAGATQEERCGTQVIDGTDTELVAHRFEARGPHARLGAVTLGFLAFVARDLLDDSVVAGVRPITVVGLVVEDYDVAAVAQTAAHAAHHLVGRLGEGAGAVRPNDRLGQLRHGLGLAELESVEVGDDDVRTAQFRNLVAGHDVSLTVVVVRRAGEQHAQPIPDCDAGGDNSGAPEVVVGR